MTVTLPLKAAIVGCGPRGRNHVDSLISTQDVKFVSACDPSGLLASQVKSDYSIDQAYASVEDLLQSEPPDMAIVAAPAHLNATVARTLLQSGIHTIMEKPPGLTAEETRDLRDIAEATGARCLVGWNRRFHPLLVQAREMISERGPVTQISAEFHKSIHRLDTGRWPDMMMDNMLLETPIHALDQCRVLAGSEPSEVHAYERRATGRFVDTHAALIVFENGCVAQFSANYTTDARLERYEIHGKGISAYLEGVSEGKVVCDGGAITLHGTDSGSGTTEQNHYFVECIKQGLPIGPPAADLNESVKTMELAELVRSGLVD